MKFATKLSLGCIALLSCALGAAGLLLTGQSFSGSLASTRTALQAQQEKEKYALERFIFQATDSAQFENYILASAAQQYAEQTADAGSSMALWLDGAYSLYSGLPAALPRTALKQALTDGENAWQLTRAAGRCYLLLTQPLDLPGVRADMLCAYDVSAVFATRDAQLRAWLAASAALLVLGGGAAVLFSRRVTRPLTALQTASEKIADGEYTQRTQVKTDDEIGALSRSFDAMAAAVEGKINELSKTTQSQQDFIAAFTHEIKTPMTAMLGYADLMRARPDDTETQREAAGYIYHETQRLENLSRSLLALMGLEQAGALGVPVQQWKLLQKGQSVAVEGRTVQPAQVLGAPRKGLSVVFSGDTAPCPYYLQAAHDADLLICDATYALPEQEDQARQWGHSTFGQSASLAAQARAKRLWLTHYSPMITDPEEYAAQAQSIFPAAECGFDGKSITLQYEEAQP